MKLRYINAPDAPLPAAAYTQAIQASENMRTLYISGQIANSDPIRPPIPISFRPPFRFEAGHRSEMKPAT